MQSYQVTANSGSDAASRYVNQRAAVWAIGGDITFDGNTGNIYMNLPAGHLPTDFFPDLSYGTISTPTLPAGEATDPAPETDVPSETTPAQDPTEI